MTTPDTDQQPINPTTGDSTAEDSKPSKMWLIIGAIIVIITLGIVADSFVTAHRDADNGIEKLASGSYDAQVWGPAKKPASPADLPYLARRMPTDPFAIGKVDAPVTIVEFSDFECPFCTKFTNEVEPGIVDKYVKTGQVRIEWNDFPVNGEHAVAAAKAGRAAAEQGRFDQFRKALYAASADKKGHPGNTIDNFMAFAKAAGVPDLEKFKADATSDKYDEAINNATKYASALGVNGTPTLIIGSKAVNADTADLEKAIDAQLAAIKDGSVTPSKPGTTDGRAIKDLLTPTQPPAGNNQAKK